MAKAHENLGHIYKKVSDAFNTLNKIVVRAEGRPASVSSTVEALESLQEDVKKRVKENPKAKWGSFPETVTTTKNHMGTSYEVEQYQFGTDEHPAGLMEQYVLDHLNTLLNDVARSQVPTGKKSKIPEFVRSHAEKLGELLKDMDALKAGDPEHPYNSRRTRS
jgi:hypothetical protein